jgi:sugar O-acyltransferase (sialic acid O-acetyltransferase NeuD family)
VDKPELLGSKLFGYLIIGNDSDLDDLAKKYQYALITVGQIKSPLLRIKLFELAVKSGFILPTVVSPRAYLSKHAMVDKGSIIMHDALINANAKVGENCIINSKALIEHDVIIKDHCHISTNVVINGNVVVGSGSFIGSGAISKEGIKIDNNYFAKAGSIIK